MEATVNLINIPGEFLALFKAGKEAARQGDKARAHTLFRKAVEIDPYHEQVWLWLASVVESDDDRRVCFQNVLELNPANPTARRQLMILEERARLAAEADQAGGRGRRWWHWLLYLVAALAGGGAGLAAASLLGYI